MPRDRTLQHLSALYRADADPWGHLTRAYEKDKYANTLAVLGSRRFEQGLEIGFGIGALTERLVPVCRHLVAIDCIPQALDTARQRLGHAANVRFICGTAPGNLPPLSPDLIVLSEVLYFMTGAEIDALGQWCRSHAAAGAVAVVVSWTGSTGEALTGAESASRFAGALRLAGWRHRHSDHGGYCIDVLTCEPQ